MKTKTVSLIALGIMFVEFVGFVAGMFFLYTLAMGEVKAYKPVDQFDHLYDTYREVNDEHLLIRSELLDKCAKKRAAYLYKNNQWSHHGWDWPYCNGGSVNGENLAKNYNWFQSLRAWIQSEPHNDNLLQDEYTYYGLGSYQNITVQLFI